MTIAMQIGKMLKEERTIKGYSQKKIADMLAMSQQQYSLCEKGMAELHYGQILSVCKVYGISPNEFFEDI